MIFKENNPFVMKENGNHCIPEQRETFQRNHNTFQLGGNKIHSYVCACGDSSLDKSLFSLKCLSMENFFHMEKMFPGK